MQSNDSIRELVRRARRRFFLNVAMAQGVLAASVGMAGAILILLFGAQFLDWRWLALAAALTFPLAYFRTIRGVPAPYRVAQIVDRRLALHDSLSTALYFSDLAAPSQGSESVRQAQLTESERIGRTVDPAIAVPLSAPRTLYLFGSLALVAAVLFGVRYGVERRIEIDRPLVSILMDAFGGGRFERRAALKKNKQFTTDIWGQTAVDTMSGPESQYKGGEDAKGQEWLSEAPDSVLDTADVPNVDAGVDQPAGESKGKTDSAKGSGDGSGDEGDPSEQSKGPLNTKNADQSGGKQGENPGGKQPPNTSGDNSLASKIKDAMSSLMASLRTKTGGPNSQPSPGKSGGDPKSQQSGDGQKTTAQGQKKGGEQASDSQDGQPGDDGEGAQSADAKGNQGSDGSANGDQGSGAGKQDGAKVARLAEQLAAMGKISEIIGKRSANVTGEVTIEVTSSKQPLRTPYSDNGAAHGVAAGEINRDEVPAAFQDYVQQYFEQIRRPAKAAAKSPTTPPGPPSDPPAK